MIFLFWWALVVALFFAFAALCFAAIDWWLRWREDRASRRAACAEAAAKLIAQFTHWRGKCLCRQVSPDSADVQISSGCYRLTTMKRQLVIARNERRRAEMKTARAAGPSRVSLN